MGRCINERGRLYNFYVVWKLHKQNYAQNSAAFYPLINFDDGIKALAMVCWIAHQHT